MKRKFKLSAIALLFLLPFSAIIIQSCTKDDLNEVFNILLSELRTGWLEEKEDMNNIPEDITPFDNDEQVLKSSVDLSDKFPPIGDQGQYGTCVAWAVGYNLKTSLNAIEKGWGNSQLASTSNQTSPKDLWFNIPSAKKGANCEGTNFEPALDALISSGAASLSTVPYTGMGNCSGTGTGNSSNKLANYRKIASETEGLNKENFKGYLNSGRPIAIGAKLGDRFMNWSGSSVITSDTYNNPGMQHAYHAMVLVGYDDSKSAFKVRNSWGPAWGDNGSIWVGYDFFCRSFCFAAFVAQNTNSSVSVGSGGITSDLSSGYDLLAYSAEDNKITNDPDGFTRSFSYDVFNSGSNVIYPSQNWSILYMYYNAKNAEDYKIIFEDYYTNTMGDGDGYYDVASALSGGWWNNYPVNPGKKVGEEQYPEGFEIKYTMPGITGEYYLVVMADGYNKINEANEDNNFYFISAANGKPLQFQDGEVLNSKRLGLSVKGKQPTSFSNTETQTLVKPGNLNTYTPAELRAMLLHDKKTGKLDAKIKAFRAKSAGVPHMKKVKK